jgi:hypothetical protein
MLWIVVVGVGVASSVLTKWVDGVPQFHRWPTFGISVVKKFLQFVELAVGEGIHRIDDQGLDASRRTSSQNFKSVHSVILADGIPWASTRWIEACTR